MIASRASEVGLAATSAELRKRMEAVKEQGRQTLLVVSSMSFGIARLTFSTLFLSQATEGVPWQTEEERSAELVAIKVRVVTIFRDCGEEASGPIVYSHFPTRRCSTLNVERCPHWIYFLATVS